MIDENGENLGVMFTREAFEQAQGVGLDLVEISPNSDPPVAKFLDIGRYKYEAQKKANAPTRWRRASTRRRPASWRPSPTTTATWQSSAPSRDRWPSPTGPTTRPRARSGWTCRAFLEHLRGMTERKLLRRVAAILYHRRAGFSANGMGVWRVPEEEILETGRRMAAVRGVSHCYQRPTYADWPYSVFTMAHGRSKEECDAILDAIADEHASTVRTGRRSTRRPSSRRSASTTSRRTTASGKPATRRG